MKASEIGYVITACASCHCDAKESTWATHKCAHFILIMNPIGVDWI